MKKGTKKDETKAKITIRLAGYPGTYIDIISRRIFDNNLSLAISKCIDVCMDIDKSREEWDNGVINDTWFESPKRHRKIDKKLEEARKGFTYTASTFLTKEQTNYVEKFCDKTRYPQFRGSKTNVIYAIIYTVAMNVLNGTVGWYKLDKDNVEVK